MEYETIVLEHRDGVARLTLNRPEAANGLTIRMTQELQHALTGLADDRSVRALLLAGAGARFCGGGDVKGFAEMAGDDLPRHMREITQPLHAALSQLVRLPVPVVAAVHGSAAGAGMGFVMAADLAVAAESCKFVMAYTGIGLTPDGSTSWFLPRLVGLRRALELTYTNRVLTAAEALDWGIVNQVMPDAELSAAADALVERLAAGPTRAFAGAKALLHGSFQHALDEHLILETETMVQAGQTADAAEGVTAFAEKRAPTFGGD